MDAARLWVLSVVVENADRFVGDAPLPIFKIAASVL